MDDSYLLQKANVIASPVNYHTADRCSAIKGYKCKWFNSGQNAFTGLRLVN
jgi:hypothetical protein